MELVSPISSSPEWWALTPLWHALRVTRSASSVMSLRSLTVSTGSSPRPSAVAISRPDRKGSVGVEEPVAREVHDAEACPARSAARSTAALRAADVTRALGAELRGHHSGPRGGRGRGRRASRPRRARRRASRRSAGQAVRQDGGAGAVDDRVALDQPLLARRAPRAAAGSAGVRKAPATPGPPARCARDRAHERSHVTPPSLRGRSARASSSPEKVSSRQIDQRSSSAPSRARPARPPSPLSTNTADQHGAT